VAGPTHYERLGVSPTAPVDEIRAAYRAVARRHHPDAAGSAAGAEMAAVNEAWRVLSDPGRRALYDASLHSVPGRPAVGPDPVEPARPVPASGQAPGGGRFPIWPFVLLFVLAVVFIVTAGALSQEPQPAGPDNLLTPGSCVRIDAAGDAMEVACEGPHDAVVVTVVGFDQTCPGATATHRDRQGRGWACVTPVP